MAVFGSTRSGINSAADLTAAGWTYQADSINHDSQATSSDFMAFFDAGASVGWIEAPIPGAGGTVRVRYGTDCCGTTKLLIGGEVMDTLSDASTQDRLYEGPYRS